MRFIGTVLFGLVVSATVSAQYEYDYGYGNDGDGGYDGGFGGGDYGYGYGYGDSYEDGYGGGYSYGNYGGYDYGSSYQSSYSSYGGSYTGGSYSTTGYYDSHGYYGDVDQAYYEYYGYYTEDSTGYEDYYYEEYDYFEECFFDANGKPVLLNGTASCNIRISGVNKEADKLPGGIDGVYKLDSCYYGKPMYKRQNSPAGEDRVLWYSSTFGDWDISRGAEPTESDILMYGGELEHAPAPLFVSSWHLGSDLKSGSEEDQYLPVKAKVACADGTVYKEEELVNSGKRGTGPVLTDAEFEAKYKYIYNKYKPAEPSPTVNFSLVVLLVMAGLSIVLAIPYFLLRKRGGGGGRGYQPVSTSFAAMLQQSRKKQAGHIA